MALKTEHVLLGFAGGGLALIGTYLLYSEYEKNKHIDEYMAKVRKAQAAYQSAIDANDVEEAQSVSEFYEQLMHEEEQVINAEGSAERLVRRLSQLGIIVFAGLISYSVIKYVMKRFPPKDYNPPPPPNQPVPSKVSAGENAYRKLNRYLKGLLHSFAEISESMLSGSWNGLPIWVIIALAAAAVVIIALTAGIGTGALAPIAAMAV